MIFISAMPAFFSSLLYILFALLILLLMVTIHELGHYLAGKKLKFKINEFAVGFGPVVGIPKFWDKRAMQSIKDRKLRQRAAMQEDSQNPTPAGTATLESARDINKDYLFRLQTQNKSGEKISLRWFPLGGFCAFAGEDQAVETKDTFNGQKPWKRIIVLAAGAVFNILSAVIFSIIFLAVVGYSTPKITGSYESSANYGIFQKGDEIIAVDGVKITALKTFAELTDNYTEGETREFTVVSGLDGSEQVRRVIINKYSFVNDAGEVVEAMGVGVTLEYVEHKLGFFRTIGTAFPFTGKLSLSVIGAFGKLITGKVPLNQIGGPVTTVTQIGALTQSNFYYLFILLPLLAANLGIFNLFPLPALDGSRIVFAAIEWIRRKPINRNVEAWIHFVGFVLLFGFVLVVDVLHFL